MTEFICEPLTKRHDRASFRCGVDELDHWFQQRARQDQDRRVAAVYVLLPTADPARIAGFYTLSATAIALRELPESFARKLPRYPLVPAILIGRLARDVNFPGVGRKLLVDALQRALKHATPIAAATVLVDAKDDRAASFYQQFGFLPIPNNSRQLFLPMSVIEKLFASGSTS